MTLSLQTYEPLPNLAPTPPEKRRSPLVATLWSLLFPGLGHLYLGFLRHACWIIGFELLSLLVVIYGNGGLHAGPLLTVPALYLFAIIDAYFSAREWNAGVTEWMTGANPRVTAILNLLTKGFGYFYLGDRAKGVVCFLAMSVAQALLLLHTNVWTGILGISMQVAVGVDGYRVARERLLAQYPELRTVAANESNETGDILDAANSDKFKPAFAMACFVILGAAMVVAYASSQALSGQPVKSAGTLEQGPAGLTYRNTREGIEVTVPEEWNPFRSENSLTALRDDGVALIVQEQFGTYAVDSLLSETEKGMQKRHPAARFTPHPMVLADKLASGFDTSFDNAEGVVTHQRILGLRRGLKIFILIETWTRPEKRDLLDKIEQTIRLQ